MTLRKLDEPGVKQTAMPTLPQGIDINTLIIAIGVVIIILIIILWLFSGYHYELSALQI